MRNYFEMKLIILTAIIAYLADIKITFRPFSITADRWMHVVGIVLVVCGCILIELQGYKDGKRGVEIREEVKEETEQENIKSSI